MNSLTNKRVLLGVCGGIAAYKSAEIVRRLQDAGASVRVVMTRAAQEFITPLTLQALSGNPVYTELLDPEAEAGMGHIELARWADLLLVAPATANFIAQLVNGDGSDLLNTICLATKARLAIAPAMNQGMWSNAATQANIDTVRARHIAVLGPAVGIQACGDVGLGRMLEPEAIALAAADLFETGALAGKTVLITAGPTREAIDPVRYISNHSSGKMGYALANAAQEAGARVVLVSGPVSLSAPDRVHLVSVESANDMLEAVLKWVDKADVFIGAAAVADYRPVAVASQKIKKTASSSTMTIELTKNPDIIATVAQHASRPFTVGFAAETESLIAHAKDKLERKNLDMIIANDVTAEGIGFNADRNAVTVIESHATEHYSVRGKNQLARALIARIAERLGSSLQQSDCAESIQG